VKIQPSLLLPALAFGAMVDSMSMVISFGTYGVGMQVRIK